MKLYSLKDNKLKPINSLEFKLEKEIQGLVEKNLKDLFGLDFIRTEVSIKSFRIDTLCYDSENKSFVIIEYKKDRNFSIIDQGYTYMSLVLNNKADFILEYNENCNKSLKKDDVDWSQTRVLFISPNFTEYQKHSVNFKDVPFELWEIKKYENNYIGLNQIKQESEASISSIEGKGNSVVKEVSKEVKVYTEDFHVFHSKVQEETRERYYKLKERIMQLGSDIEIVPRSMYIGFKRGRNFIDVYLASDYLWCWLNMKKSSLDDPKNLCRDVSEIGHYGNGDYELKIRSNTDLDYVMYLVKQAFNRKK